MPNKEVATLTDIDSVVDADSLPIRDASDSAELKEATALQLKTYVTPTAAETKTAYESNTDTNAFTDAEQTKLAGIEASATADQTGAEIKAAYEGEANTNAFTDAEQTKLAGIETAADVTDATNVAAAGAVMDSDISEAEGFLRKTGVGAYEAVKTNLVATVAPTANEDSGDGYAVGSFWIDVTADKAYVCLDATAAAAVWTEITSIGGGSGTNLSWTAATSTVASDTGTDAVLTVVDGSNPGLMASADKTKLDGIETAADVTDATNVAAAGAVMDSDISEAEGLLRKTGAGAYEAIKTNLAATVAPTANEDSGDGYAVGSLWIDVTADKAYVCLDATAAAAVWTEITGAGSTNLSWTAATSTVASDTGTDAVLTVVDGSNPGLMASADKTKLDGVAASATANPNAIDNLVEDTTPQLGGQLDVNGNALGDGTLELLSFTETVSAVNHVNITNAATGNGPTVAATGDDTNVDLLLAGKGSGVPKIGANTIATLADTLDEFGNPAADIDMADFGLLQVANVERKVQTVAATGATETLDNSLYGIFDMTMDANCTFTFSNPAASGEQSSFVLYLRQDATGGRTATLPASVDWHGGTAPTLTTTASATDVLAFHTVDGGTTWLGFALALDIK